MASGAGAQRTAALVLHDCEHDRAEATQTNGRPPFAAVLRVLEAQSCTYRWCPEAAAEDKGKAIRIREGSATRQRI